MEAKVRLLITVTTRSGRQYCGSDDLVSTDSRREILNKLTNAITGALKDGGVFNIEGDHEAAMINVREIESITMVFDGQEG